MNGFAIGTMFWRLLFVILLVAVIYLSWKPNPAITQVSWVPRAFGVWLDEHDFAKNFAGYGTLAFTVLMAWARPRVSRQQQSGSSPVVPIRERNLLIGFCSTVLVLELGQLALRSRVCDWRDVVAGWAGGLFAWILFRVGHR